MGSDNSVHAVLGLGNPGPEYRLSRHNLGFLIIDRLAERHGLRLRADGPHLRSARWRFGGGGNQVWLAQPMTYMNSSGRGARHLCSARRLDAAELLVIVDDVDLPFGGMRIRESGGAGTHNGMRSLLREIGDGFPRLRVGIGPALPSEDLAEWVLGEFEPAERDRLPEILDAAADCVEATVRSGLRIAMNRFNRREPSPEGGRQKS